MKKTLISIAFMLAILPVTVYAQASIYKLPKNRLSIGVGYMRIPYDRLNEIWMNIELGLTDKGRCTYRYNS